MSTDQIKDFIWAKAVSDAEAIRDEIRQKGMHDPWHMWDWPASGLPHIWHGRCPDCGCAFHGPQHANVCYACVQANSIYKEAEFRSATLNLSRNPAFRAIAGDALCQPEEP